MTDSMIHYDSFNNKLNEFFTDLVATFPDVSDFKTMKLGLSIAKNFNMKMPQQIFHDQVVRKFEKQIKEKDEGFFLNYDYADVVSDIQSYNLGNTYNMDIVGKLKTVWTDLSEDNKNVIWKYFHILIVLNSRCL